MKLLWPFAFLLSLVSAVSGARVEILDGNAGLIEPLFYASSVAAVLILVFLLVDYWRDVGSKYRGSDTLRMRIAVINFANIGVILLAVGFPLAGIGLLVMTLAFFAHGTIATKELLALHAEWDAEREAGESRRAAAKSSAAVEVP